MIPLERLVESKESERAVLLSSSVLMLAVDESVVLEVMPVMSKLLESTRAAVSIPPGGWRLP